MSTRLTGVVFDLDGTLAETHPMAIDLIGESIVLCGGPELDAAGLVALFGPNEKGIFRAVLGQRWEPAWDHYLAEYVSRHRSMCPEPFPGIREVVELCAGAGCRLAVVTGKTGITGRLSLDVLGLTGLFPEVRGGSIHGVVKRADIATLLDRWGLEPGSVVYVGDVATDVVEARAAGVAAVGACWSEYSDARAVAATNPDFLFVSVADFTRWVRSRLAHSPRTSTAENE